MPSRLSAAFAAAPGTCGLVPYLTAGFPSPDVSLEVMLGFAEAGARAIEVGIPFSDPIADGPDIQRASEWALRGGVGVPEVLDLIARFRARAATPVVIMTYFNPVLRLGLPGFAAGAKRAGADAVLVSDLPPDESPEAWEELARAELDTIVLVAPTTDEERLPALLSRASGFVYCLARTGVTGRAEGYAGPLAERIAGLRARTKLPVAVGFGISSPEDARPIRPLADAIVVGAAFMREIASDPDHGAAKRTRALADALIGALR